MWPLLVGTVFDTSKNESSKIFRENWTSPSTEFESFKLSSLTSSDLNRFPFRFFNSGKTFCKIAKICRLDSSSASVTTSFFPVFSRTEKLAWFWYSIKTFPATFLGFKPSNNYSKIRFFDKQLKRSTLYSSTASIETAIMSSKFRAFHFFSGFKYSESWAETKNVRKGIKIFIFALKSRYGVIFLEINALEAVDL